MFEFVRKHTRIIQIVLLLLIFPSFVFFGVQGFSNLSKGEDGLASVANQAISRADFENALRLQEDRVRSQQPNVDARMFSSPEFKQQVLDALMRERVLAASVDKLKLVTPDARLMRLFASDPQLEAVRNPDGSVNKEFLAARGINSAVFAEQLRRDYSSRQVLAGVGQTSVASVEASKIALDAVGQRREIQLARFDTKAYVAQAQPTPEDLRKFYADPTNAARFQAPEHAQIEYLVLDLDAVKSGVKVAEADVRKFYDDNAIRYQQPEERRASHILIKADKGATAQQRQAARAKAAALLEQVRKNPGSFAELAKKNSEDTASAVQGGDLDFFGRDAMAKPFADAVFALKVGQVSDVVETEFGYHIILVTGVRGGEKRAFDAVRAEIENELKVESAKRSYAQAAEQFTNTVYEQSDSLKPAADLLKLTIRTADLSRAPGPSTPAELVNPKLIQAIFDAGNIKQKRNTDAIEVGSNRLVSARVLKHEAARPRPYSEVEVLVRDLWIQQRAVALAKEDAQRQMAAWKANDRDAKLSPVQIVSRRVPISDAPFATQSVLQEPVTKSPAWMMVDLGAGQGYAVVRINKLLPASVGEQERNGVLVQYARMWGQAEDQAYYAELKKLVKAHPTAAAAAAIGASEASGTNNP